MKKIMIAAAAMLLSVGLFAQNPTIFVKAGVGLNKWTGDDFDLKADNLVGYSVAAGFEQPLTEAFVFGAEIGAQTRGYKLDDFKQVFHGATISPFVGYHIVAGTLDIEPHVGMVASYDLVGKWIDGKESEKIDFKDYEDFRRLGVAANPGVTVWFGNFGVDVTWQRGVLSVSEELKVYDSQILARVAYRF